jgi:pilus assembly protein CpaE
MRRLARLLRRAAVPEGHEVVTQGVLSDRMYVIASGRCEVRASWEGGHSVTVALLGPGDFFGFNAVHEGVPQSASVTTTERTVVLELLIADLSAVIGTASPARAGMEKLAQQRSATVDQVIGRAGLVASGREGRVIAVYSVKGGSGKTTIAVNIAAALSGRHRGECVLLDLGLPYNHAALMSNLVPTGCLAMLERVSDQELEEMLLSACVHHSSGMLVLPGTLRVEQSELITPLLVQRAMSVLIRNFGYIVIDLGVAISETTLMVLERATKVVLVVTNELTAMRDSRDVIGLMRSVLNISEEAITVVLNHPRPSSDLARADIATTIGRAVDFQLDHDAARADRAAVTGELLVVSAATSPVAKQLRALAFSVADETEAPAERSGRRLRVAR